MIAGVPWLEVVVALLLILSGICVLISAIGFVRLHGFFLRMHPPALAYTLGTWSVAIAAALYFSVTDGRLALHPFLIPIVFAITVPVTTLLLARVSLFRERKIVNDEDMPTASDSAASPPSETRVDGDTTRR